MVAVWGGGIDATAASRWLADRWPDADLVRFGDDVGTAVTDVDRLPAGSLIVRSPGVPRDHPLFVHARARGVTVTTSFNLWLEARAARQVVAVTGTKGKTTVTRLVAHLLERSGRTVALAGNGGVPLLGEVGLAPVDVAVVEASSYVCADIVGTVDVAAVTNLFPEHLDWHGSAERYFSDKLRLVADAHARVAVVAGDDETVTSRLSRQAATVRWRIAGGSALADGVYSRDVLERVAAVAGLAGEHNVRNVACAAAVVAAAGVAVDGDRLVDAAGGFVPAPHRLQHVADVAGVSFVDDAIATIPEAAVAALDVFASRPVVLLAGGHDRGVDLGVLVDRLAAGHVEAVVVAGPAGRRLAAELAAADVGVACHVEDDLGRAVAWAARRCPAGGVVLLSPAAASYGLWRDHADRAEQFHAAVLALTAADGSSAT